MGLRYKKPQLGLTRGVINVPTCINRIQSALPRNVRETDRVAVAIKRRLNFKNDYAIGRIRIHIVMKALKQLFQTMLYKLEDVKIDNEWEKVFIESLALAIECLEKIDQTPSDPTRFRQTHPVFPPVFP